MPNFNGTRRGSIYIRPLTGADADVALMAKWLTDERVLAFYEGRDKPASEERVREVYLPQPNDPLVPCIVEHEGVAIGYLQFYPIDEETRPLYSLAPQERAWGIDQFIGEVDYWNRGIGTAMVRTIVEYLFAEQQAERVVLDPRTTNTRAIRVYEKCGFAAVKVLPEWELHEGVKWDCLLMAVTPETYQPG